MQNLGLTILFIAGMILVYVWGGQNPSQDYRNKMDSLKSQNLQLRSNCMNILDKQTQDGYNEYLKRLNGMRK